MPCVCCGGACCNGIDCTITNQGGCDQTGGSFKGPATNCQCYSCMQGKCFACLGPANCYCYCTSGTGVYPRYVNISFTAVFDFQSPSVTKTYDRSITLSLLPCLSGEVAFNNLVTCCPLEYTELAADSSYLIRASFSGVLPVDLNLVPTRERAAVSVSVTDTLGVIPLGRVVAEAALLYTDGDGFPPRTGTSDTCWDRWIGYTKSSTATSTGGFPSGTRSLTFTINGFQ